MGQCHVIQMRLPKWPATTNLNTKTKKEGNMLRWSTQSSPSAAFNSNINVKEASDYHSTIPGRLRNQCAEIAKSRR